MVTIKFQTGWALGRRASDRSSGRGLGPVWVSWGRGSRVPSGPRSCLCLAQPPPLPAPDSATRPNCVDKWR